MVFIEKFTKFEHKLRPFLIKILPLKYFIIFYSASRSFYIKRLSKSSINVNCSGSLNEQILFKNNLKFRNDLGNAAGFDKDGSLLEFNYKIGAGFAVVGTVLSEAYSGNLIQTFFTKSNPWTPLPNSRSAINSLGLPSKGIKQTVENVKKFKKKVNPINFPIGVSIMGHPLHKSEKEKLEGISRAVSAALEVADFIEINESCPNTEHAEDQESMRDRISKVIELRDAERRYVPILVKLRSLGDVEYTLKFLADSNVDGVVLVNTQVNYEDLISNISKEDRKLYQYYTEKHKGGVSGAAIKNFSFAQTKLAAEIIERNQLELILIHVGGITTNSDIEESRAIHSKIVPLREWYTGLMEALGSSSWDSIYTQ